MQQRLGEDGGRKRDPTACRSRRASEAQTAAEAGTYAHRGRELKAIFERTYGAGEKARAGTLCREESAALAR